MYDPKKHSVKNYKFHPFIEGFIVSLISVLSLLLVTYFLYHHARVAQDGEIKEGLLRTARIVASAIDVESHKTLHDPKLQVSELYKKTLEPLRKTDLSDEDIEYVYTTIIKDDKIYFILDAADAGDSDGDGVEDKSFIMDPYDDASNELIKALNEQVETVSDEPYKDAWGYHISVFVPFFDKNKNMEGVLGIDINAKNYVARLEPIKVAAQRAAVGSVVISFFFGLAVWFLRNFTYQMNASRQAISKDYENYSTETTQEK